VANQDSPVLWAVVEAAIRADKAHAGKRRPVSSQRILHGPNVWPLH
jgi:hypothetical protein